MRGGGQPAVRLAGFRKLLKLIEGTVASHDPHASAKPGDGSLPDGIGGEWRMKDQMPAAQTEELAGTIRNLTGMRDS